MKRTVWIPLTFATLALCGCSADEPRAPIGLDKRPANSASAIADLFPQPAAPDPLSSIKQNEGATPKPPLALSPPQAGEGAANEPVVISDFSAPGGVASLAPATRVHLINSARNAALVSLFCRGDRAIPSSRERRRLVARCFAVKRFLETNGVSATHIRVLVRSSGSFVADNRTSVGRAQNRRIEIRFG